MVLPWVTDRQSKPFRSDLLGCPYFDAENDDIVFAIDRGYSLNLTQTPFSKLIVYPNDVLSFNTHIFVETRYGI